MTKVAILQSCYMPWKGYFDIIGMADIFVIYDDVQYSKNHWHNRNQIKTDHGLRWLTVPVSRGAGLATRIDEVTVARDFAQAHLALIEQAYEGALHFAEVRTLVEEVLRVASGQMLLTDINYMSITAISRYLGLFTPMVLSRDLDGGGGAPTERLVRICKKLGATSYLSGPSAQSYLEVNLFKEAGIDVEWMDYSGYGEYRQLHGNFIHNVSILDLIFNLGHEAPQFMKFAGSAQVNYGA